MDNYLLNLESIKSWSTEIDDTTGVSTHKIILNNGVELKITAPEGIKLSGYMTTLFNFK